MKNINRERTLISFMILMAVTLVCAFILFGADHDNGPAIKILQVIYSIIAFPNTIMWILNVFENWYGVAAGILSGALFFSFLIEFVLIRLNKKIGIR